MDMAVAKYRGEDRLGWSLGITPVPAIYSILRGRIQVQVKAKSKQKCLCCWGWASPVLFGTRKSDPHLAALGNPKGPGDTVRAGPSLFLQTCHPLSFP